MNDVTMGNQQATESELGWLAGIYDGEGYFGLCRQGRRARSIKPHIELVNCDPDVIVRTVTSLRSIGVNPYLREVIRGDRRKIFKVVIGTFAGIKTFLDLVGHLLTGEKKKRADLVHTLVNSRIGKTRKDLYTDQELEMVETYFTKLKGIKIRGNTHLIDSSKVWSLNDYTRGTAVSVQ